MTMHIIIKYDNWVTPFLKSVDHTNTTFTKCTSSYKQQKYVLYERCSINLSIAPKCHEHKFANQTQKPSVNYTLLFLICVSILANITWNDITKKQQKTKKNIDFLWNTKLAWQTMNTSSPTISISFTAKRKSHDFKYLVYRFQKIHTDCQNSKPIVPK